MAAGETRYHSNQPLASLRHSLTENLADLSDSGYQYDDNSRNVVRWLESLPSDNRWCEAEEQIARADSSEAIVERISSIGDTDVVPVTLGSRTKQPIARTDLTTIKKFSRKKKYRRGALHGNSSSVNVTPRSVGKINVKREKVLTLEESTISTKNPDNSQQPSTDTSHYGNIQYRPVFDDPEFGNMLDYAMSRAIDKYKINERTWDAASTSSDNRTRIYEPPSKRPRPLI